MSEQTTSLGERLIEIVAVLLLGIATVGTAWCGYQSSQWNGTQSDLARESSDERVEAGRLFGLATQKIAYDANIVAQYAQAVVQGDDKLAQFYRTNLVRPAFVPLLDKWVAEIAAGQSPTSLFEDQDYLQSQFGDYQKAIDKSEVLTQQSQVASATSDEYVINTILLAIALFFAGVTSSFRYQPARVFLVLLAVGTVALAAVRLADLPVA
ncbi:MAG: hypothetical protein ABJD68_15550 [Nakamurella sp.]